MVGEDKEVGAKLKRMGMEPPQLVERNRSTASRDEVLLLPVAPQSDTAAVMVAGLHSLCVGCWQLISLYAAARESQINHDDDDDPLD
jgi:hypothetical protein